MGGTVSVEAERAIRSASDELDVKLHKMAAISEDTLTVARNVFDSTIKLASGELDGRLQTARVVSKDTVDALEVLSRKALSSVERMVSELDGTLQTARVVSKEIVDALDVLRGRVLSTSIALVYLTSLLVYALHKRPASGTAESYLFMLQFMILSIWAGSLVERKDAAMVAMLALSFLAFVYQRGRRSVPKSQPDAVKVE